MEDSGDAGLDMCEDQIHRETYQGLQLEIFMKFSVIKANTSFKFVFGMISAQYNF